ncbi:hypothetical protein [Rhodococcus qingshengii]|nr:hypothetical protein [Rhodococcus qingshengii]
MDGRDEAREDVVALMAVVGPHGGRGYYSRSVLMAGKQDSDRCDQK